MLDASFLLEVVNATTILLAIPANFKAKLDHFRQLIATHRSIPFKESGKPSGISDGDEYAMQIKLVRLSRERVLRYYAALEKRNFKF
jgi:hypothetical protein